AQLQAVSPQVVQGAVTLAPNPVSAALQVTAPMLVEQVVLTPDAAQAALGIAAPVVLQGPAIVLPNPVRSRMLIATPTLLIDGVVEVHGGKVVVVSEVAKVTVIA